MANDNSADDTVSLKDLVQSDGGESPATVAGAPVPESPADASRAESTKPAAPESSSSLPEPDFGQVDDLLADVDPEFSASLRELGSQQISDSEIEIEALDLEEWVGKPEASAGYPSGVLNLILYWLRRGASMCLGLKGNLRRSGVEGVRWVRFTGWPGVKSGAAAGFQMARKSATRVIVLAKKWIAGFIALPRSSKALVALVLAMSVALALVLKATFGGQVMPRFESEFLYSFAPLADAEFSYDSSAPMENFGNPLLHPEHVVLIDRLIVNLRPSRPSQNPMGLFEIYVESSNREGAIEIKDREGEARDVIGRSLEKMPYEELAGAEGKSKAKLVIRRDLNQFLTQGRVRRVYFKTVVLKP